MNITDPGSCPGRSAPPEETGLKRAGAFAIDLALATVLGLIAACAAVYMLYGPGLEDRLGSAALTALLVAKAAGFLLLLVRDLPVNGSPGKRGLGLAVMDGSFPMRTATVSARFLRNLTLLAWPVEAYFLLLGKDNKRLGDRMAGTVVVRRGDLRAGWLAASISFAAIAGIVIFTGFTFLSITTFIKSTDSYRTAITAIEDNGRVTERTGGIVDYGYFPTGNVNVNGPKGSANYKIKVIGVERDVDVYLDMTLQYGEWHVDKLVIKDRVSADDGLPPKDNA